MGKRDTAEWSGVGGIQLDKVGDNNYLITTNSRYYNPRPEPWNTSLALFGVDSNTTKLWEYYLPLNDYCTTKEVIPTSHRGLWAINQCSGNLNSQNGTYDYFIKVAYLDSSVFWPEVITDIVEPEIKAKEIKVYPNPASDQLTIKQYGQIVPLEGLLFNLNGQLIERFSINSHQNQFSLGGISPSNYVLKIIDAKGREVKTEKIVVVD
jgi:hypothetical protein